MFNNQPYIELLKNKLNKINVFYLVMFGWILGLSVNLISFFYVCLAKIIPFVLIYHIIIIFIWIYSKVHSTSKKSESVQILNKETSKKSLLSGIPEWLNNLTIGTLFFAILSFMFIMAYNGGAPDIKDGRYILHNHTIFIRYLTEQEYIKYKLYESKMFFGHWTAFYGFAVALLYKNIEKME